MSDRTKEQINVRVDESTKDDWEAAIDEYNDIDSISMLVRLGVAKELRRRERDGMEIEELHASLSDQIEGVHRTVKDVENNLDEFEKDALDNRDLREFADGMMRTVMIDILEGRTDEEYL